MTTDSPNPADLASEHNTPPEPVTTSGNTEAAPSGERLQKLLARAGIASRRAAEEIIREGRVSVNGHVITELGTRADLARDRVIFDGRPLTLPSAPPVVVLLHKPKGYMTTTHDPEGRPTVLDLIERDVLRKHPRLHPIGRLDFDTSGVLLLTDDGELTQFLTHPSHGVAKVYQARVSGTVKLETVRALEAGIKLEDGMTAPCRVRVRAQTENNALVEITLHEGRNRQVRRMLQAVGHPVSSLRRISLGGVDVKGMATAESRVLLPGEVAALRKRAEEGEKPRKPRSSPPFKKPGASKGTTKARGGDTAATGRKSLDSRHSEDARVSRTERPKAALSAGRFTPEEPHENIAPRRRNTQATGARRDSGPGYKSGSRSKKGASLTQSSPRASARPQSGTKSQDKVRGQRSSSGAISAQGKKPSRSVSASGPGRTKAAAQGKAHRLVQRVERVWEE